MKKWQTRFIAVATSLGLIAKVKEGKLSADEQKKIFTEYEKKYKVTFQSDKEADDDEPAPQDYVLSADEQTEIANLINDEGSDDDDDDNDGEGGKEPQEAPKTGKEANAAMKKVIIKQKKTITKLAGKPESDDPVMVIKAGEANDAKTMAIVMGHTPHSKTHLFGNDCDFMSLGKWWNKLTATRREVRLEDLGDEDRDAFKKEFNAYTQSLINRSSHLSKTNSLGLLDYQKMISGTASFTDYKDLDGNFGEFTVRRQDIILAFFRSIPSVANIFPVQSNVRNKEVVPTVQFGELSQGYRKGRIFKGNVKFASEIYWVNDVMFKYEFDDMIALQKRYVMDLTKGSSVFQWTFIEWCVMWFGKQLFNEQQRRRVIGSRVPQQNVVSNPAMLASDGVLRAIQRAEEELKVLPFDFGIYTEASIVDYIENFWDEIDSILPNMEDMRLYVNAKHRKWYLRAFRKKYGNDTDFTGVEDSVIDVNPEQIIWVPNMPNNCYKMWITSPGNVENLEYVPNEMLGFRFKEDFESVTAQSRWMEGSVVQKVGVQYKTPAELIESGRKNQWLFTNFAGTKLDPDATVIDGSLNNEYQTVGNTAATTLNNISNPSEEVVYKIICGSISNATKIMKTGKFAKISADWIPGAVGDFIKLHSELEDYDVTVGGEIYKATRPTGNFLELDRRITTP
jgi:hypothetical protein